MKLGKWSQTPGEKKLYTADYSQWLSAGETLATVTYVVTPVTVPALQVTGSAIDGAGKTVSFFVGGGTDSSQYEITLTATTNIGEIKVDAVFYAVKNI